ncbi:MAG: hypothetical protein DYG94_14570 [Leptolyngbya sp. PLA3]|nr:MAG: hypothetical protein EDM82_14995 [Cyanobacteria bacterium CYA]MCE7969953.1 hypothetical protein [Leptolyngbya sp. PL-A3]
MPDGPPPVRAKAEDPDNLQSFVALAYARKGQRIGMKKKVAVAIAQGPPPDDAVWARIQDLARHDVLLAVPKQMLLAAIPNKGTSRAWSQVLEACLAALRVHPASSELVPMLLSANGGGRVDELLDQAAAFRFDTIPRPGSTKPLSASHTATLRANVTGTVALWMVAVWGVASPTVLRSLHERVWSTESRRASAMTEAWRRVLDVRDPSALGLACDAFVSEANHARRDADAARTSEAAALRRMADLEATITQLKAQLDQERSTNEDLRRAATQASRDAEAALSHARDDYERLRTRVLRRLTREVELLDEGMLAIKREPPKLHVMTDHGDRALSGLREEIKALQREAGQ